MPKESVLRGYVTKGLRSFGHIIPVENTAYPGHPDIDFCIRGVHGHIELKKLDAFPKRPATQIRIEHYTPVQRLWMKQRSDVGGRCYVLVKVAREYFLFDVPTALHITMMTQEEWREQALEIWTNTIVWVELVECLTRPLVRS